MAAFQTMADLGSWLAQPKLHVVSCFFQEIMLMQLWKTLMFSSLSLFFLTWNCRHSIKLKHCGAVMLFVFACQMLAGEAEMLFEKAEKPPSLLSCLLHRDAGRPKLPSKKAITQRKFEVGLKHCGLDPFCLSRVHMLFTSCRLCSSPAFVMHSWWHIKILSTVLSAITSFSWMDILFVENTVWCSVIWAEMNTEENLSCVTPISSEISFPVEMSNYSNLFSRQERFWQSVLLETPAIHSAWIR